MKTTPHPVRNTVRRIAGILLASSLVLLASGCETQRGKDLAAIERAVESMKKLPVPREQGKTTVNSIDTDKGRLRISTCGASKNEKGEWISVGPSRTTGFFILPRAIWVDDIQEARKLLLEDYEKGNLMPSPQPTPSKSGTYSAETKSDDR